MSSYDDDDSMSISRKPREASGVTFVDFILFKSMVAPWVLIILFYIVLLLVIIAGVVFIIIGIIGIIELWNDDPVGLIPMLLGVLTLVLGPISLRIYVEFVIIVFRIHDVLTEIRDKL
ncbi:MAG: DUF4282 domain-containing protein [Planctomycetes bacterium]|nr:DUF4282 domain-containing protein [Planctomycetota bacterium]